MDDQNTNTAPVREPQMQPGVVVGGTPPADPLSAQDYPTPSMQGESLEGPMVPIENPQVEVGTPATIYEGGAKLAAGRLRKSIVSISVIAIVILLLGGAYAATNFMKDDKKPVESLVSIPSDELRGITGQETDEATQLTVNSPLFVNNKLVVQPSVAPSVAQAQAGEIFFDADTSHFVYYDGTGYQTIVTSQDFGQLSPLSRATPGAGLNLVGDVLSNSGVLSLQGQAGNVNFLAGPGIGLNGLTITNTGVIALQGTTGQINVSQSNGSVTLSLPQSITTTSSPTFAGLTLTGAAQNGVLIGGGNSPITSVTASTAGLCLVSTGAAPAFPTFSSCTGGNMVVSLNNLMGNLTLAAGTGIAVTSNGSDTLTISQSGSSGVDSINGQTDAVTIANASGAAGVITINDATTTTKGIASFTASDFDVSNGAVSLDVSVTKLGNSVNVADGLVQLTSTGLLPALNGSLLTALNASNITSGTLGVAYGGTGQISFAANSILLGNGTAGLASVGPGNDGECLVMAAGVPTFATCTGAGGVSSLNGQTGAISIANASASAGLVTIQNASTSQLGLAQFNSTNFSVSNGVVNTIQDIHTSATPTFAALNLQGPSGIALSAVDGASKTQLSFTTPIGSVTRTIVVPNAAGTLVVSASGPLAIDANGNITCPTCLTSGGGGGTAGVSSLTGADGGSALTGALTIAGANGVTVTGSGTTLTITGPTIATGVSSINGQNGALNIANVTYDVGTSTFVINDATTTTKGIASFTASDFDVSSGAVSLDAIVTKAGNSFNGSGQLLQIDVGGQAGVIGQCLLSTTTGAAFGTCPIGGNISSGTSQTPGALTRFDTATNQITDSIASESGATITVQGTLAAQFLDGDGSAITDINASNITSGTLSIARGGTGRTSFGANTVLLGNGGSGIAELPAGSDGQCLVVQSGAPVFATCTGAGGVGSLNGKTGSVTIQGGTAIDIDNSGANIVINNTGVTQLQGTPNQINLSANTGNIVLSLPQDISLTSNVTFNQVTLGLNGSSAGKFILNGSSSNSVTLQAPASPTSGLTFTLPVADGASGDCIRTDGSGNLSFSQCIGGGTGGGISGTGVTNRIAKFTAGQEVGNSSISDDGSTVAITVNAAVQGSGGLLIGTPSIAGILDLSDGSSNTTRLRSASLSSNITFTLPGTTGSNGECIKTDGSGNLSFGTCLTGGSGSGVNSLIGASGGVLATGAITIANATSTGSAVTIDDAGTSMKGIASFSASNFSVSSGAVSIKADGVALGTNTTGNYVASITAGGGLTGGGTGEGTTAALAIGAGNGITVNADDITVNVQANKGIEVDGNGISLIDCATNQTLKYSGAGQWECADDLNNGVSSLTGTPNQVLVSGSTGNITLSLPQDIDSATDVTFNSATLAGANALTLGQANTDTGAIIFANSTNSFTTTLQSGAVNANLTFTLPIADGSNGQCMVTNGSGVLGFASCLTAASGVTSVNSQTGALTIANATGSGGTITLQNASTTQLGLAQFNGTNFSVSNGVVNTIQDIATTASPTFNQLTLTTLGANGNTPLCLNGFNQIGGCASGAMLVTLQQAYNASANPEITLDSIRGGLTVRDASTPITGNLLEVQNNSGSITYLGVSTDGTTISGALRLLNNSGANTSGILFGSSQDTNLYRSAANTLRTDNTFHAAGEIVGTGANQFRAVGGNYGTIFRQDGSNLHILLTDSGDQYGNWNSLRPLSINNTSGLVTMQNGLTITGNGDLNVGGKSIQVGVIQEVTSPFKAYRNLAAYNSGNGASAGAFVIETNVPIASNTMTRTVIEGYFYDSTGPFRIEVGGYMRSAGDFPNRGYVNVGAKKVSVRFGTNTAGNGVIILGETTDTFAHPKLAVTYFLAGHSTLNDNYGDGWTISQQTDLSAYSDLTIVPETTTISDDILSSNVALLDRNSQTFTGNNQLFKNISNSATAFQIQNAGGANLLAADTTNMSVLIGTASSGSLQLLNDSGTNTSGILFGSNGDVNLYRSAANTLSTDDGLLVTQPTAGIPGIDVVGFANNGVPVLRVTGGNSPNTNLFVVRNSGLAETFTVSAGGSVGAVNLSLSQNNATAIQLTGGTAGITFGGDVSIARTASNILQTGGRFDFIRSSGTSVGVRVGITNNNGYWQVLGNGTNQWGDGTAGYDTTLYRSAANVLQTDDSFVLNGTESNLTVQGTGNSSIAGKLGIGGTPTYNLDVTGDINYTGYIRQGGQIILATYGGISNLYAGVLAGNAAATGGHNIGIGRVSLNSVSSGDSNIGVGSYALTDVTTGTNNVGIGYATLGNNATGHHNTAVGYQAGNGATNDSNITGNALFGYRAGYALQTGANYNVLLGYGAGSTLTTGSQNIIIGYNVQPASITGSNQLHIGNLISGDMNAGILSFSGSVGINLTNPGYALDVNGDINSSTAIRVGGIAVCTVSTCTPASGSNNYIQNSTTVQSAANISVRSASASAITALLQGANGQTADILRVQSWNGISGSTLFSVGSTGSAAFKNTTDSATAFQVQNTSGASILNVNTTNGRVGIGAGATSDDTLDVDGDMFVRGNLRLDDSTRQYTSDYSTSIASGTPIKIGEYTFAGNSRNVMLVGEVRGQTGQASGVSRFVISVRANTLPSKAFTFSQDTTDNGRPLRVKVYQDEASGKFVLAYVVTGSIQNAGWTITAMERGNYDGFQNSTTYEELDTTGLTEVGMSPDYTQSWFGNTVFQNVTDSTTALQIQDANDNILFNVDTTRGVINIGGTGTNSAGGRVTFGDYYENNELVWVGEYSGDSDVLQLQGAAGVTISDGNIAQNIIASFQTGGSFAVMSLGSSTQANSAMVLQRSGVNKWEIGVDGGGACSDTSADMFYIYTYAGGCAFNMTYNGEAIFTSVNSDTAFRIQNVSAATLLGIDTLNSQVLLGDDGELDGKLTFENATNGNTISIQSGATSSSYALTLPTSIGTTGQCLALANGTGTLGFADCGGGAETLQDAYDGGNIITTTDNRDLSVTLANTATDSNFKVNIATGSTGQFQIQANGTNTVTVNGTGQAVFKNSTNSTTAFQIQKSDGTTLLGVDTTNNRIFSTIPDSSTAIGFTFNTPSYTTNGAKLLSVQNNGAEKFSIDKNGHVKFSSGTPTIATYNASGCYLTAGSNDVRGQIRVDTIAYAHGYCTVYFANPFASTPFSVVSALSGRNNANGTSTLEGYSVTTTYLQVIGPYNAGAQTVYFNYWNAE